MMQIDQRDHCGARRADFHADARDRIQHPCRQRSYHAGRHLDVNKPAAGALLTVVPTDTAPVQRMPTVMDLDFLPDMGRMTGRLPLAGRIGLLQARMREATGPPPQ